MLWIWVRRILGGFILLSIVAAMTNPNTSTYQPADAAEAFGYHRARLLMAALGVGLLISAQRSSNRRRRRMYEAQVANQQMAVGHPGQAPVSGQPPQPPAGYGYPPAGNGSDQAGGGAPGGRWR